MCFGLDVKNLDSWWLELVWPESKQVVTHWSRLATYNFNWFYGLIIDVVWARGGTMLSRASNGHTPSSIDIDHE